jgi:hypothetical protein
MKSYIPNCTYDAAMLLKDAGAVASSAAAQVAAVNQIVDLNAGANTTNLTAGLTEAGTIAFDTVAQIDVTAIDVVTGDEGYTVCIQGSNSPTFASGNVNLGSLSLGGATGQSGAGATFTASTIGRYILPFTNWLNGTTYRYIRAFTVVSGTTPSINYTARIGNLGR